jgi:hypothetical protein
MVGVTNLSCDLAMSFGLPASRAVRITLLNGQLRNTLPRARGGFQNLGVEGFAKSARY